MFRQVVIDPFIETQSVHLLIIVIHVADTENVALFISTIPLKTIEVFFNSEDGFFFVLLL